MGFSGGTGGDAAPAGDLGVERLPEQPTHRRQPRLVDARALVADDPEEFPPAPDREARDAGQPLQLPAGLAATEEGVSQRPWLRGHPLWAARVPQRLQPSGRDRLGPTAEVVAAEAPEAVVVVAPAVERPASRGAGTEEVEHLVLVIGGQRSEPRRRDAQVLPCAQDSRRRDARAPGDLVVRLDAEQVADLGEPGQVGHGGGDRSGLPGVRRRAPHPDSGSTTATVRATASIPRSAHDFRQFSHLFRSDSSFAFRRLVAPPCRGRAGAGCFPKPSGGPAPPRGRMEARGRAPRAR
jgi:hypothetical protein